jgi:hypothetical protein
MQMPNREETRTKESRMSNESKLTPQHIRKVYSKEPSRNIPSYMYQHSTPSQPDRTKSNILAKPLRRQNTRGHEQLPNLIETPNQPEPNSLLHR